MPDALGVLTRDCSPLGPLQVLHLFKASTVCHKRDTVEKIRHGNKIISKVFGLYCLINSGLEYLLWCSFSGPRDVNIKPSLFGNTCHKTLRRQLEKRQEISIRLWQICQRANITVASHIPLSHHVIGLWNCVPVLKTVPTSSATARQGREGNEAFMFSWHWTTAGLSDITYWQGGPSPRATGAGPWHWKQFLNSEWYRMVVNTGGNINLLDTQLFPSSSEEKAGGWLEYARAEIWPGGHQLACASLEHPEGYSKLHSQKDSVLLWG